MKRIDYRNANGYPPTVCIELLKWCNLKCSFCRSSSSPFEKESLEYQEVSNLLTELARYGTWRIALTGGEPLFWSGLTKLLGLIAELKFPFSVTTNGYSRQQVLEQIPRNYWNQGTLYVSLDGNKEIHNKLRGANSFERTIGFLKFARERVPRLFVGTVLLTDIEVWARELYAEIGSIGVDNWTLISPVKSGSWNIEFDKMVSSIPYTEQFEYIKAIVKESSYNTTASFLDFAKSDGKYIDVVSVKSNREITLPGFLSYDTNFPDRSMSEIVSILDKNAPSAIYSSVVKFIKTQGYML